MKENNSLESRQEMIPAGQARKSCFLERNGVLKDCREAKESNDQDK
jgi:hypothetical protein